MSKCESSLPRERESDLVGRLSYNESSFSLTFLSYIDTQGFKRFLRVTWEPFEAQFQSIETRFKHHTNIVVRLACIEHQIHFYQNDAQDKQRQEGECNYRISID